MVYQVLRTLSWLSGIDLAFIIPHDIFVLPRHVLPRQLCIRSPCTCEVKCNIIQGSRYDASFLVLVVLSEYTSMKDKLDSFWSDISDSIVMNYIVVLIVPDAREDTNCLVA